MGVMLDRLFDGAAIQGADEAAEIAQTWANAACRTWGHDFEDRILLSPGAATIANLRAEPIVHQRCRRCGVKT
jgi:hypothetical protein